MGVDNCNNTHYNIYISNEGYEQPNEDNMDKNKIEQMIKKHEKQSEKTCLLMKIVFSATILSYVVFMIEWYSFTH